MNDVFIGDQNSVRRDMQGTVGMAEKQDMPENEDMGDQEGRHSMDGVGVDIPGVTKRSLRVTRGVRKPRKPYNRVFYNHYRNLTILAQIAYVKDSKKNRMQQLASLTYNRRCVLSA